MKLPREAVQYLIVHQTATPREQTTFEGTKRYHVSLGWGNIAYHYFIESDGRLRKGRNERTVGTHTKAGGMNLKSLGICLAGNFNEEEPTDAQLKSLEAILKNLAAKYKIQKENILGHREVPGAVTECPGDNLLQWIERYREETE
jgi:N-acetyl-anhydromuramyl-L-alanine amidase AmpD